MRQSARATIILALAAIALPLSAGTPSPDRAPFRGAPFSIPGSIEAEDFDQGGEGISYHDRTPTDDGRTGYRDSAVDIRRVDSGGYRVADLEPGEWLEYTVRVARAGRYTVAAKVASLGCGGTFHVEFNGRDATGPLSIPNTNSFNREWTTIRSRDVQLDAGLQTMRMVIDASGKSPADSGSIDVIYVTPVVAPAVAAPKPSPAARAMAARVVEAHPRLFVTAERLAGIKRALRVKRSFQQRAFEAMSGRAYGEKAVAGLASLWQRTQLAREAALLYLLTDKPAYASTAYALLASADADVKTLFGPAPERETTLHLLTRSATGMAWAIVYDWCYAAWSPRQRAYVRGKIVSALEEWPCVGHQSLESPHDSAWVPVFRGAELIMMLAVGEERARPERYEQLKTWLDQHMAAGYGPSGLSEMGVAATTRAGAFLIPAVQACRSVGDHALDRRFEVLAKSWWRLLMATASLGPDRMTLDSGWYEVSGFSGGWPSLLLGCTPPDQLPFYLWFYDRYATATETEFDARDGGTTWALLNYPEQATLKDPNGVVPTVLEDPALGAYFFRNRWRDGDDVLASVLSDSQEDRRLRVNVAEAFNIGLIARGRRLIHSAGTPNNEVYSTLTVDGHRAKNKWDTGHTELYESKPPQHYVIVDGHTRYKNLGLQSAKRHVLVDFSGQSGSACLIGVLDRLHSTSQHIYGWQLNYADFLRRDVKVRAGSEAGVRTFTIGRPRAGETYLKGWVLSPAKVVVNPSDVLQIGTRATDADIWIVMAVVDGDAPVARVTGAGLDASLTIGNVRVGFDRRSGRMFTAPAE